MKLLRSSGTPINYSEMYQSKMNARLDELILEHGKDSEAMKKIQPILEDLHLSIVNEHPLYIEIDYPESEEELAELINKYGAVAFCEEDGVLVCYIMDAR